MAETVLPALGAFVGLTLQPNKNQNIAEIHGLNAALRFKINSI